MTEHVIVSFTYNCNNDALVRVLNYLFIVSCFERTSHLNKWPRVSCTRKGWWKLSPRIKITRLMRPRTCYAGTRNVQRCINFDRFCNRHGCMFIKGYGEQARWTCERNHRVITVPLARFFLSGRDAPRSRALRLRYPEDRPGSRWWVDDLIRFRANFNGSSLSTRWNHGTTFPYNFQPARYSRLAVFKFTSRSV